MAPVPDLIRRTFAKAFYPRGASESGIYPASGILGYLNSLGMSWDEMGRQRAEEQKRAREQGHRVQYTGNPYPVDEAAWGVANYLAAKARGVPIRPGTAQPWGLTPEQQSRLSGVDFPQDSPAVGARAEGLFSPVRTKGELEGSAERQKRVGARKYNREKARFEETRRVSDVPRRIRLRGGQRMSAKEYIKLVKDKQPGYFSPEAAKSAKSTLGQVTRSAKGLYSDYLPELKRRGGRFLSPQHHPETTRKMGKLAALYGLTSLGKADLPREEFPVRHGENIMQDPRVVARNIEESRGRYGQPADPAQRAAQEAANRAARLRRRQAYGQAVREAQLRSGYW